MTHRAAHDRAGVVERVAAVRRERRIERQHAAVVVEADRVVEHVSRDACRSRSCRSRAAAAVSPAASSATRPSAAMPATTDELLSLPPKPPPRRRTMQVTRLSSTPSRRALMCCTSLGFCVEE